MYRREEVLSLLTDYFKNYPSRTPKNNRLLLLSKYYELKAQKAHLADVNSMHGKAWSSFLVEWGRWGVND